MQSLCRLTIAEVDHGSSPHLYVDCAGEVEFELSLHRALFQPLSSSVPLYFFLVLLFPCIPRKMQMNFLEERKTISLSVLTT